METRYYDSQIFKPENELSADVVAERAHFVRAFVSHDTVERAEIVNDGKIKKVLYLREEWSPVIAELHGELYETPPPFEVRTPDRNVDGMILRDTYVCSPTGTLNEVQREISDLQGWIREEQRLDSTGALLLVSTYEYNDEGEITTVTTRDATGKVLSVEKSSAA